jgi:hypothetical protein
MESRFDAAPNAEFFNKIGDLSPFRGLAVSGTKGFTSGRLC